MKYLLVIISIILLSSTCLASELSERILKLTPKNIRADMEYCIEKVCNNDPVCIEEQYECYEKNLYILTIYHALYPNVDCMSLLRTCCSMCNPGDYKCAGQYLEEATGMIYKDIKRIRGNAKLLEEYGEKLKTKK